MTTPDWHEYVRATLYRPALAFFLVFFFFCQPAGAYSVLSHEEVVDMAWLPHIVPLLRARYPDLTDNQLREAHAYAYGGSVIQDIGYYPFGSHDFSDVLHYIRTGDFVSTLIRDSNSVDEYAFALGALAHYCGDVNGHPVINHVTSDEYPKLAHRFGPIVTYGEDPIAHLRTEFGFDVVEVAHGRYSQENYRDFIGFQVSKELLNRAFQQTYGLPVDAILTHEDLAIGTYRRSVSILIPKMTTVALVAYQKDIEKEAPGFDHRKFVYRLERTEYEKQYGKQYANPGLGSRILARLIEIMPKVGPFKAFQLKVPTPTEQDLYLKSINATVDHYDAYLKEMLEHPVSHKTDTPRAPDLKEIDLDTGKDARLGEYPLADRAYAFLLDKDLNTTVPTAPLAASASSPATGVAFAQPRTAPVISPDLRQSFLDFYANDTEPAWYRKKPKQWTKLQDDLQRLHAMPSLKAGN